ncbi:TPA: hypothetical protein IWN98_001242 [Enterococcus faecium]|uniref:Uncharacterized protein n=3 Tax=Enterococcus TaxID=1350 RepID=A0A286KC74_ENTAV|nr:MULTISPECIES: hypothetical protein [Enterococcus]APB62474.1 hypothetical protein pEMA120_p63 [Enterococcus faecium]APB62517.1 hypothetical protein pEA19081_p21 [Enterococcus avium]EOF88924.1 hypothetical protein SKG_02782 [Enterococcus faecium EnGen0166]EOH47090.1 hypothetical protein SSI_01103 [Enterococcus faecium EnGen0191]EOM17902.1 hypothetical protein SSM_03114 [Enterococcus faecium EnGen0192]
MELTKGKRIAVVRFDSLSINDSRYIMPVTDVVFKTEDGIRLIWRLPIKKSERLLKKIKVLEIEFVVTEKIAPETYLIEQVKIFG